MVMKIYFVVHNFVLKILCMYLNCILIIMKFPISVNNVFLRIKEIFINARLH